MSATKAFINLQGELPIIPKERTAKGRAFSYKYADITDILNIIRPLLKKHGFHLTQGICRVEGDYLIMTTFTHESGEKIQSAVPFVYSENTTPQEMGSHLTYYRRYGLATALAIATDEDTDSIEITKKKGASFVGENNGFEFSPSAQESHFGDDSFEDVGPRVITDKQRKRLFAIAKKSNWNEVMIKNLVLSKTGQESTAKIPWTKYEEICKKIEESPGPHLES